jgi:hypothetical protein
VRALKIDFSRDERRDGGADEEEEVLAEKANTPRLKPLRISGARNSWPQSVFWTSPHYEIAYS